jgi:hypothetical protein
VTLASRLIEGRGKYCSTSCRASGGNRLRVGEKNAKWRGGVSRVHYRYKKRFAEKSPEKVRAHRKVAYEIQMGRLTRKPCTVCATTVRVHAHHDDYSKPLQITWMCQPCHNRQHAEARRGGVA